MPTLHALSIRNLTSSISHFPVTLAAIKVVFFLAPAGPLMALKNVMNKNWFCNFLRELPHHMAFEIANHYFSFYD